MKKLFVVVLFMVFINIFIIMFNSLGPNGLFPIQLDESEDYKNGSDSSSEAYFKDISSFDASDVFKIIFFDTSQINSDLGVISILASIVMMGGAAFIAWLTHSPAPFVVAVVANVFKNLYMNSIGFLEGFGINDYIMLVGMIGMIILLIVTCLEYLTHGEA